MVVFKVSKLRTVPECVEIIWSKPDTFSSKSLIIVGAAALILSGMLIRSNIPRTSGAFPPLLVALSIRFEAQPYCFSVS